ncbi:hypothetical protein CVT25_010538 [Psilocybe cyanescens]|uniref:Uncharacterized protein n=1 Tax=Psilocybe cyanescens TaxID=93625 RepID=A0A409XGU0_PSICY|nr:hypothetical protein CVT25_010538 [Psilocybe cyanescens]
MALYNPASGSWNTRTSSFSPNYSPTTTHSFVVQETAGDLATAIAKSATDLSLYPHSQHDITVISCPKFYRKPGSMDTAPLFEKRSLFVSARQCWGLTSVIQLGALYTAFWAG